MDSPVVENRHHQGSEFFESVLPHSIQQFRAGHMTNADAFNLFLFFGCEIERVAQKGIGVPLVTWVAGSNRVKSLCETNLLHQQKNARPNAILKLIVKAEMSKGLSRLLSIFELVLQRIDINRKGIVALWKCELRLVHGLEIISEISAAALQLSGFEPVHVVVNITHSSGELFAGNLQTRQTLRDSSPLSTGKQRDDLLVLARDRAQNRIGLGNEAEQIMAALTQRDLLL